MIFFFWKRECRGVLSKRENLFQNVTSVRYISGLLKIRESNIAFKLRIFVSSEGNLCFK